MCQEECFYNYEGVSQTWIVFSSSCGEDVNYSVIFWWVIRNIVKSYPVLEYGLNSFNVLHLYEFKLCMPTLDMMPRPLSHILPIVQTLPWMAGIHANPVISHKPMSHELKFFPCLFLPRIPRSLKQQWHGVPRFRVPGLHDFVVSIFKPCLPHQQYTAPPPDFSFLN